MRESRERFHGARVPQAHEHPRTPIDRERADSGIAAGTPIGAFGVAPSAGRAEQVAREHQGRGARVPLPQGALHLDAGVRGTAMSPHGPGQRDALGWRSRPEAGECHTDGRRGVIRLGGPRHQAVERVARPTRVSARERQPGQLERAAGLSEGFQGGGGIAGGEQRLRPGGTGLAGRGSRQAGEQAEGQGRVAGDAGLAEPQPAVDDSEARRARRGVRGAGRVGLPRGFPRERLPHREEGRAPFPRFGARGGIMRRRRGAEPQPSLGFGQDRERFTLAVILEPRLAHEEATGAIVAARVQLGLGAFYYEGGIQSGLPGRRGKQRLRSVPGPSRQPQRFRPLRGHCRRGLLARSPGPGQRESRTDEHQEARRPGHALRRTWAKIR